MNANTRNLVIDLVAFAVLIVAAQPELTGVSGHEWVGIALTGTLLVHLALHRRWVTSIALRFFGSLQPSSRLNALVDTAIFVQAAIVAATGVAMSRGALALAGLEATRRGVTLEVHEASAEALVLFVAMHLFLHRTWIARTLGRMLDPRPLLRAAPGRAAVSAARASSSSGER